MTIFIETKKKIFMKKFIYLCIVIGMVSCTSEKTYNIGQIITPKGEILIWLYNETPKHKASFTQLANNGYWDNYTFNRVIPNFVAQGGCPDTPEGFNDPEYLLEPEFDKNLRHIYGAVGAGRDDNPKMLSARCQFYIVQNKNGLSRLDDKYTIFGKVIKGMDIVNTITNIERDSTNKPLKDISLDVNMIKMNASELEKIYPEGVQIK